MSTELIDACDDCKGSFLVHALRHPTELESVCADCMEKRRVASHAITAVQRRIETRSLASLQAHASPDEPMLYPEPTPRLVIRPAPTSPPVPVFDGAADVAASITATLAGLPLGMVITVEVTRESQGDSYSLRFSRHIRSAK